MDLRQLKYFVAIAERHSFNSAADALHIAQSALSRHMAALEDELGGALFERGTRGSTLTESGVLLLVRARLLLAQVEDTRAEILAHNGELRGTVRFAAPPSLSQRIFPALISHFADRFPKVHLQLSEGLTAAVITRILDGSLDIAIASEPIDNDHLRCSFLMEDPVVLVGPRTSSLGAPLEPHALSGYSVVMASGFAAILGDAAKYVKPLAQVDSTEPVKALIRSGKCYGLMPLSGLGGDRDAQDFAWSAVTGISVRRNLISHKSRSLTRPVCEASEWLRSKIGEL